MSDLVPHEQALTPSESTEFSRLEVVIERGLATFVEVGLALMKIRDARLYRETHATFEDYCRERWSFTRRQGDRLIEAAEVAEAMRPIGLIPTNEAQARELVPLLDEPEKLREAVVEIETRVSAGEKRTAKLVATVVEEKQSEVNWCDLADRFHEGRLAILGAFAPDTASAWTKLPAEDKRELREHVARLIDVLGATLQLFQEDCP